MNHLEEIWALLPMLKAASAGGVLSDIEAIVSGIEVLYNDWQKLQEAKAQAPKE